MMSVEEKEDAVAFSWMAEFVVFVQHAARELHAETDEAAVPIGLGHFAAFGVPPEHVLGKTWAEGFAGEEVLRQSTGYSARSAINSRMKSRTLTPVSDQFHSSQLRPLSWQ